MTCIAFDPRENEQYIKVFYDFNVIEPSLYFSSMRVQQIDANYSLLLGKYSNIAPIEFSYQPLKQRFPALAAVLLKRIPYVMNRKVDGQWKKVTLESSPFEKWFLDLIDANHEGMFDNNLWGFINCSSNLLDAVSGKHSPDPNATGLLRLDINPIDPVTLPNCEFKPSADSPNANAYKGSNGNKFTPTAVATPKKEALDSVSGYYATRESLNLSREIIQKLEGIDDTEKLAITLAVLIDKLQNR